MFLPYITGDWHSSNMTWEIGAGGGLGLAMTWLYFMGWSSYGFETVAAFAPEYHAAETDTPRALRASAAFSVVVYALLPLGLGGTLGTATVADDATAIAFYTTAFDTIVGNALGEVMIVFLIAGLLLSMNTATMDGSRALYGISQDGMTTKLLGRLNRYSVPGIAMTLDAILNLWLISYFGYPLDILAASNLGYILAHVFALTGFLLLRKDRPNWPRPIKLAAVWVPIAALLAAVNLAFIVVGGFIYSGGFLGIDTAYGYGWDKTRIGLIVLAVGLLLYVYRKVVEDRTGIRLREDTPTMPEEAAPRAAPRRPGLNAPHLSRLRGGCGDASRVGAGWASLAGLAGPRSGRQRERPAETSVAESPTACRLRDAYSGLSSQRGRSAIARR